jgi:ABC-2 type transport system ATP-binding protein
MDPAVKIKNLSVTLGGKNRALQSVTIDLPAGKMIGFIGPSGAGKTTLIRSIVGRLKIETGSVMVFNETAGSPSLRSKLTYMTQEQSIYADLNVRQNLIYFAKMAGQSKTQAKPTVKEVLQLVGLENKADALAENLSGGQKQRVSLAIALIGSPKLMVLDEPTVGLDPVLRDKLWGLFNKLADKGVTLIISSHSMDEASRCDDLVLIRNGRVIAHSSPKGFLEQTNSKTIEEGFLKLAGGGEG